MGRTRPGPSAPRVDGWGECAALADSTFDAEDAARSHEVLREILVPALLGRVGRQGGALPAPSDLRGLREAAPGGPLAFAALEMAVADLHLRAEGRSFARLLGVDGRRVEPGAVVGMAESADHLVASVGGWVDQGYSRVKLKIGPGWDVEPVGSVAAAFPGLRLQADANGSYLPTDGDHLVELDRFGLLCIEQPFGRHDLAAHVRQALRMTTPICLDESLDSPRAVAHALTMGACSVVCVKPARLGGLGAALSVIERCAGRRVPVWMGGMFETGFARGVNTALGALTGMAWPGDLSPSRTYLGGDLVPETPSRRDEPRDGRRDGPGAGGGDRTQGSVRVLLPSGPGMGPAPEAGALARYASGHLVIDGPVGRSGG
jgi:O-succinylbenzoate synthase